VLMSELGLKSQDIARLEQAGAFGKARASQSAKGEAALQ
jgi:hypothetical protein